MPVASKPAYLASATEEPENFRSAVVEWFDQVGENHPWRQTRDPYAVLVSELMLQQTRIETVLSRRYFERWMEQFPDVQALADADVDAVLKVWEGLGYYRRARNLKKAAETVVSEHEGKFPRDLAEILALPGVGRYTAGAVASFAYGASAPIVDANVARVFSRIFDLQDEIDSTAGQRKLWDWADALVPLTVAREFNSGLMELGQKVCTSTSPDCISCPISSWCRCSKPEGLPKKKPKRKIEEVAESVFLALSPDGSVLLERETGERRTGLLRLPHTDEQSIGWPVVSVTKYTITRYRVTLTCLAAPKDHVPPSRHTLIWCGPDELQEVAIASPYRKVLHALLEEPRLNL